MVVVTVNVLIVQLLYDFTAVIACCAFLLARKAREEWEDARWAKLTDVEQIVAAVREALGAGSGADRGGEGRESEGGEGGSAHFGNGWKGIGLGCC